MQQTRVSSLIMKTFGGKSTRILSLAGAIDLSASQRSSMPTDLAKKWTGGDCGLRQSTGNADRTIDMARLRECDLRKGDLTSLGYRASLAGFVTHTANLDSLPAGY